MKGSVAETKNQIIAVPHQASRKMVDVYKTISRDRQPIVDVIPQFFYSGTCTAYETRSNEKLKV